MADPFRRFRVAHKQPESSVITSFYLQPEDDGPLWDATPGQYLTLRIPVGDTPLLRTYSLSCAVDHPSHHRISVKREAHGAGSAWLHDHVSEGDVVEVAAPRGGFVLDEDSTRPVLLLAGGVGMTPLLSMAHRLAATDRRVWFIHAVENGDVHALRDETAALMAETAGRITVRNVYRAPTRADRDMARFDAEGMVDRTLLQSLLPLDDYQVYLCGPTPFMVAMWRLLTGLGIAPERIAYEFFGKGGSLARLAEEKPVPADRISKTPAHAPKALAVLEFLTDPDARALPETMATTAGGSTTGNGVEVVFARSGVTASWNGESRTILELAEAAGLEPEFSCREGICNTCICDLREGKLEYLSEPLDPPPAGRALICCSRPAGRVVLDL